MEPITCSRSNPVSQKTLPIMVLHLSMIEAMYFNLTFHEMLLPDTNYFNSFTSLSPTSLLMPLLSISWTKALRCVLTYMKELHQVTSTNEPPYLSAAHRQTLGSQ